MTVARCFCVARREAERARLVRKTRAGAMSTIFWVGAAQRGWGGSAFVLSSWAGLCGLTWLGDRAGEEEATKETLGATTSKASLMYLGPQSEDAGEGALDLMNAFRYLREVCRVGLGVASVWSILTCVASGENRKLCIKMVS